MDAWHWVHDGHNNLVDYMVMVMMFVAIRLARGAHDFLCGGPKDGKSNGPKFSPSALGLMDLGLCLHGLNSHFTTDVG